MILDSAYFLGGHPVYSGVIHDCTELTNYTTTLFIGGFGIELHGTSPTAACQTPKFPAASIYVPPAVANWIFRGFVIWHPGFLSRWSDSYPHSLRGPAVESERFKLSAQRNETVTATAGTFCFGRNKTVSKLSVNFGVSQTLFIGVACIQSAMYQENKYT